MSSTNDITGDSIQTKPSSQAYREGYDRAFSKPTDAASIKDQYQNIGLANSSTFKRPEGRWLSINLNTRGNYELWFCHELKQYYHNHCD